jgi:hypothetical protein
MSSTKEAGLREKIREAIQEGRLPEQRPTHTWGGRGSGAPCAVCGQPISPDEFEFELEYARPWNGNGNGNGGSRNGANGNGRANLNVHLSCCSTWESERRALLRSQAESAGTLLAANEGGNMRGRESEVA